MTARGIIYIATGKKYVDEAAVSARSAKEHMPDIEITLFSDQGSEVGYEGVFDNMAGISDTDGSCRDKIRPLLDTPYERTLFLDTDTFVCAPVYDIFKMLDRFDIALAHAPDRYQYDLPDLPDCFTELNSGVIAFRKSEGVLELLKQWEYTFYQMLAEDSGSHRDQHSLRDAIYRSDLRFLVLPPEYNFRTICPNFAGKHCAVKILHGRHSDPSKVAAKLNRSKGARVFLENPYKLMTKDLTTYDSLTKTTMNKIFEILPVGLQKKLSNIRNNHS